MSSRGPANSSLNPVEFRLRRSSLLPSSDILRTLISDTICSCGTSALLQPVS